MTDKGTECVLPAVAFSTREHLRGKLRGRKQKRPQDL